MKTKLFPLFLVLLTCTNLCAQNSGYCGSNLLWSYDSQTKALSITGYGDMYDFSNPYYVPWYEWRADIDSVSFAYADVETFVGMYIKCAGNGWQWQPMTVDPNDNKKFTYEATVTDASNIGANIGVSESADGTWYDLGDMSAAAHGLAEGDAYKYVFTSTDGATGTLEVVPANNAPARKQKSDSGSPIPQGITSIGAFAFYGCSNLTSVTIPNSVTSIGNNAFWGCSVSTINYIGSMDEWCNKSWSPSSISYNYHLQLNGVLQQSAVIPNSVTSIGEYAFRDCSGLTSITIPNSVTSIGSGAFYGCTGLTSVTIPNSVTSIGEYAFRDCSGLTSITIPNSVTSIGYGAFYNCSGLTSVTIPNSVTSIGSWAFSGCSGLISVIWNAKNYADFSSNNTPFYDSRSQITSFTIGNEVEHIPAYLCNGMSNLTSVTIGNSVTSIGYGAFYNCSGLTSVIWNAKNWADVAWSGNTPFYDLRSQITSFTFGNEVEHIPAYLCNGMSNLTSVTIPNSVTSIGSSAFSGCSGLTGELIIPNSVTSIGNNAFSDCSSLTGELVIPNSITNVGDRAFYNCSGLTSVTILSENFETEGGGAIFINCPNLTHMSGPAKMLYMPDNYLSVYTISRRLKNVIITGGEMTENEFLALHEAYKSLESVDMSAASNTTLSDEAFKDCYNLTELKLPAGLTKINYMAVAGCVNLQSINIPASVEEIEQRAFEDCRSIQTITFGGSANPAPGRFNALATASQLRRIGNWAFYNAHELQNLEIPEGVTEIGDGAFYGCTYLEEMVLPSSVQSIGDNCFALCSKLTKITCNAVTPPTIQAKTFFDVKRQIPVYVPDEAVSAYENDTYWQEFDIQGQSEAPQGIEEISSSPQRGDRGRLILVNGQILILRGDRTYTLTGQEVK